MSAPTVSGELEALKLRRIRLRNEIGFLRNYQGADREAQERALREDLHALNAEIEKCEQGESGWPRGRPGE